MRVINFLCGKVEALCYLTLASTSRALLTSYFFVPRTPHFTPECASPILVSPSHEITPLSKRSALTETDADGLFPPLDLTLHHCITLSGTRIDTHTLTHKALTPSQSSTSILIHHLTIPFVRYSTSLLTVDP